MSAANGTSWVYFELDTRLNLHVQMKLDHQWIEIIKMCTYTSIDRIAKENSTRNGKVKDKFWLKDSGFAHALRQEKNPKTPRFFGFLEIVYGRTQHKTIDTHRSELWHRKVTSKKSTYTDKGSSRSLLPSSR